MSRSNLPHASGARQIGRRWFVIGALLAGAIVSGAVWAQRVSLLRYSVPAPEHWQVQPPASNFRLAQFRVPAAPGASDGEAVVFHFGAGGIDGAPKPSQMLLAVVVGAPEGNVIFQLHGDGATVQANRGTFLNMVKGWQP